MRTIEHTIEISAPPSEVWRILTDTDRYDEWNPFMTRLSGQLRTGQRLTVTIRPKRRSMTFKPTVVALEPHQLIRWRGTLGVPGLFDGDHELRLVSNPHGGTTFTQRETFTGLLIPLMAGTLSETHHGFAAMNQALRDRTLSLGRR